MDFCHDVPLPPLGVSRLPGRTEQVHVSSCSGLLTPDLVALMVQHTHRAPLCFPLPCCLPSTNSLSATIIVSLVDGVCPGGNRRRIDQRRHSAVGAPPRRGRGSSVALKGNGENEYGSNTSRRSHSKATKTHNAVYKSTSMSLRLDRLMDDGRTSPPKQSTIGGANLLGMQHIRTSVKDANIKMKDLPPG